MLGTGGSDCTVRLWDLEAGLPSSTSRKLGHTIRSLSLDDGMLVRILHLCRLLIESQT